MKIYIGLNDAGQEYARNALAEHGITLTSDRNSRSATNWLDVVAFSEIERKVVFDVAPGDELHEYEFKIGDAVKTIKFLPEHFDAADE